MINGFDWSKPRQHTYAGIDQDRQLPYYEHTMGLNFVTKRALKEDLDSANRELRIKTKAEEAFMQAQLSVIVSSLVMGCPRVEGSFERLASFYDSVRKYRAPQSIALANSSEGVGVVFVREGRLSDRACGLFLPRESEPVYRQKAVNVDPQALGSRPIEAIGLEAMAGEPSVPNMVSFCAGAILVEKSLGWPHAIK